MIRFSTKYSLRGIAVVAALPTIVHAGAFVSTDDLVVATLDSLSNSAPAVVLREYSVGGAANGGVVNTVAFDTTGGNALRGVSGTGNRDGILNRSPDGRFLIYGGYRQDSATANPLISSSTAPRVIGLVNASGASDASVSVLPGGSLPIRSATSTNGVDLWYTIDGTVGSIGYIKSDGTNQANISPDNTSYRSVYVTSTELFGSTGTSGTGAGAHRFGGLPTGPVANPPLFIPATGETSAASIITEDLSNANGAEGIDTVYFVGSNEARKFSKVSGAWVENFSLATPTGERMFGVADRANALGSRDLYFSTDRGVYRLLDGGYNSIPTLLDGTTANFTSKYIAAGASEQFRGIAFAVPEPASLSAIGLGAFALLRRRAR